MRFKSIRSLLTTVTGLAVCLTGLSLFNIYLTHLTQKTWHAYRQVLTHQEMLTTLLASEEDAMGSVQGFSGLIRRYKDLAQNMAVSVPGFDPDLIKTRRQGLEQLFATRHEIAQHHTRLSRLLPTLTGSVRYIHEHHIVYLKNMLRHGLADQRHEVDEAFQRSSVRAAPELEIIRAAVDIQNLLLDVYAVFNQMQSGQHPSVLKDIFSARIKRFYEAINRFEDYSLDAQDGLLVEELLLNGRNFETSFLRLLKTEGIINSVTRNLARNQGALANRLDTICQEASRKAIGLAGRLNAVHYTTSALSLCLLLGLLMSGKHLIKNLRQTVRETRAIQRTLSYQIPIPERQYEEFRIVYGALNRMARTIERQVEDLEAAQADLSRRVGERTSELEQANLILLREIEDRTRSEKERRELETKLNRAKKMEAIGTLAGGVAHDLNNILSGVVSYPDLILSQLSEDDPMHGLMATIKTSGERAAAIVQDLLTLARRGVQTTEVVNLRIIVEEYLQSPTFAQVCTHHPKVQVRTQLSPDTAPIKGSQLHLQKTLMNLVSNAAEAMPHGGQINVSTENVYIDTALEGYDQIQQGDYVKLTVTDTGIGIAEEDIDRIFEPFFTKKKMGRSGTGLGMAVVWGTVKDHGGHIDVHSTHGQGTRFSLYFPMTRETYSQISIPMQLSDISGNGETILVVDDVAEQRQIASEMLTRMGYRVETAESGQAAVDYLKIHTVDLLILDMIMPPGMDGLETFRRIVPLHPGIRAIIASGYSETDRVREAQQLGASLYVRKPYTLEKIGVAVKQALTGQP